MQPALPPAGPKMQFDEWCSAIVSGVRALLPEVKAARKGQRLVIIRHGDRTAQLEHSGSTFWIQFAAESSKTTMASMYDARRDRFTTANFTRSIAGFFDARFTRL